LLPAEVDGAAPFLPLEPSSDDSDGRLKPLAAAWLRQTLQQSWLVGAKLLLLHWRFPSSAAATQRSVVPADDYEQFYLSVARAFRDAGVRDVVCAVPVRVSQFVPAYRLFAKRFENDAAVAAALAKGGDNDGYDGGGGGEFGDGDDADDAEDAACDAAGVEEGVAAQRALDIGERIARRFLRAFYARLLRGHRVADAFAAARARSFRFTLRQVRRHLAGSLPADPTRLV
jgi:hypothetical protein